MLLIATLQFIAIASQLYCDCKSFKELQIFPYMSGPRWNLTLTASNIVTKELLTSVPGPKQNLTLSIINHNWQHALITLLMLAVGCYQYTASGSVFFFVWGFLHKR